MCFGHDGEAALRRSLAEKGASRRSLFRGAAAGAAGAAVLGATAAAPAQAGSRGPKGGPHGGPHGGGRHRVPHDRISIQLYTLRDALGGEPGFDTVLRRLAQYGYERVELAGYYGRTAAELRTFLDGLGIRASSSHDGISETRTALRTKLENAATLGQTYVVVPYLASNVLADWQRWADQMNAEAAVAKRYGLRYGYHNHAHEFTTDLGGGLTPWEVLTDRLDPRLVHLEVDLYWAYTGGVNLGVADPDRFAIKVVRDAPQRVRQFHVKDRDATTGDMADLGTGVVDFPRIFRTHKVEEYIVENDTPDVTPLTSAAVGHLYLDHLEY
ncbi:sugar phosphate isomerase/epimerase family protein [Nocardioides marmotae]|uniref:sugar phosphate isomerase/epimerase family protein n=1 Tax=Nocardioides marmotae TaxID=2663857 RepID=UPI0012B622FE|nr:sugar phosphate isomerase/epimerase [Nocardioides marmotae]MBC9734377.1 sugar phosphate isomerase/epimerase [Nocardioides marmotae]MTB85477.1 TIM barrel protein [Nocardioides marmotae]